MMNVERCLIYDGSFEGFLTCIFTAYEEQINVIAINREDLHQEGLFSEAYHVLTDDTKASRVWEGLKKHQSFAHSVYRSFLSEITGNEMVIYQAVKYVLATSNATDYGHPQVLKTAQVTKMVGREKHRMEAFIRFQRTKEDLYFAIIGPDFNVLPLIAGHFKSRYADQKWIIYDKKRNYGLYYDLKTVESMQLDFSEKRISEEIFEENEAYFSRLWKDYFKSTTIRSRINMKLHIRHVPKRYWKYLNEKAID